MGKFGQVDAAVEAAHAAATTQATTCHLLPRLERLGEKHSASTKAIGERLDALHT